MTPTTHPPATDTDTDTAPETVPALGGLDSHHDSAVPLGVNPVGESDTLVGRSPTVSHRPPVIPGYSDLTLIGRGATGAVYRATQVNLNRTVALKVLHGRAVATPDALARFRAEAHTVARIHHPNVIQVYDIGEEPGVPYIAVEFVDGGTLEQRLAAGPLPVAEAVRLVFHIARGVGAAHASGVIHRDLKPANILLTKSSEKASPTPKVADFGLATQPGGEDGTPVGTVLGTPAYMSPEQAAGEHGQLGPRTDVYALGAILFRCLTGRPPHQAASAAKSLELVLNATPLPVGHFRRDVPDDLEALVKCCLRANPDQRYPTADAVADELARLAVEWKRAKLLAEARAGHQSGGGVGLLAAFGMIAALVLLGFHLANEAGWFSPPTPAVKELTPVLVPKTTGPLPAP